VTSVEIGLETEHLCYFAADSCREPTR
jgi:hypothetical protein